MRKAESSERKHVKISVQNDTKLIVQRTIPHPNCFRKSHNASHTSAFSYEIYKMANNFKQSFFDFIK